MKYHFVMKFIGQRASFPLTVLWLQHDLFLPGIPCKLLEDDQVKVGLFRPCVAELYVLRSKSAKNRIAQTASSHTFLNDFADKYLRKACHNLRHWSRNLLIQSLLYHLTRGQIAEVPSCTRRHLLDARLASEARYDDTLRTDRIGQVRSCPLAPFTQQVRYKVGKDSIISSL